MFMWNLNSSVDLILLHSERPKLYIILAFLSAIGLSTSVILIDIKLLIRL